jgi:thiamine biosynthesis protein ThiS
MIDITVNGETKSLPDALTVAELVAQLGLDSRRVAVEVNRELVPRSAHAQRQLAGGDAVEIVTLVGGGAN